MILSWWRKFAGLKTKVSRDILSGGSRRKAGSRLQMETLEDRVLLAARVWDGGGAGAIKLWSDPANWAGDVAPNAGDDLIFSGVTGLTAANDFAAGTRFNSISFVSGGFDISGSAIELVNGLTASNASGNNAFTAPITLLNLQTFVAANPGTTLTLGAVETSNLLGSTGVLGTSALTVDGAGTLAIGGVLSGQGSVNKVGTGSLILAGANTYAGLTRVTQGVLNVRHASALGDTQAGTEVLRGGAIQVENVVGGAINEPLALLGHGTGIGFADLGALRSVAGNNTWAGSIQIGVAAVENTGFGVDAGSTLTLSGPLTAEQVTARGLEKWGAGELVFAGNQSNTYSGNTTVFQGTLSLGKTGGALALQGSLIIGDFVGSDDSAVVRLLEDNQIPRADFFNTAQTTITINPSGLLDLNGRSDGVGHIVMHNGPLASADIATGSGTLTLGGNLTVNGFQGSNPLSPVATISGNLELGTFFSGTAGGTTHTFLVNNTALASVDQDLIITANISGSAAVSLTRTGTGVVTFAGTNTYAGPTILAAPGVTRIGSDTAFGTGLLSIQNNGTVLRATGATRTLANPVSIDSNFAVRGSNDLTFTGEVTLTASRIINILDVSQTTTFAGGLTEGIYGNLNLTKGGRGTLAITAPATYSGTTTLTLDGGALLVKDGGTILNSSAFVVNEGATLRIDNSGTMNLGDRINDVAAVTLSGGDLSFIGANMAASSETVGILTGSTGFSATVDSATTGPGGSAHLIANALVIGTSTTINFVGTNTDLSADGLNRISFISTPIAPTNGILPASRVRGLSGVDFTTYVSTPTGVSIIPLPESGYVDDINQATSISNVRLAAGTHTLASSRTISALLLEPGAVLNGPGAALTIANAAAQSAILMGDGSEINVETLNLSTNAFVTTVPGASAVITSTIAGSATVLTKAGTGTLVLTGDNLYGSTTQVNAGVLNIQRSTALGSPAGATIIRAGAALELEETDYGPVQVGPETLTITGTGLADTGGLRSIAGASNSWAGNVVLTAITFDLADLFPSTNTIVGTVAMVGVDAGALALTGVISGSAELLKVGAGVLELGGVLSNTYSGATRIKAGTLRLNKLPGLNAVVSGTFFVGDDDVIGAPGVLTLGGSDQMPNGVVLQVGSTGSVQFNGFADAIGGLVLTVGPGGASQVELGGGTLILNGNLTTQQLGSGNATGARIDDGTLALALFGTAAATTRTYLVNDGAVGDALTITAAIVNGSDLPVPGFAITKTGFGTLVYGGTAANTYTGLTAVSEGELALDKPAGVNAFSGALTVGDTNFQSGGAGADVVTLRNHNQIPDFVAAVIVNTPGLLNLNGFSDAIGTVDAQTGLTISAGSVSTGSGTLTVNGNIILSAIQGVTTVAGSTHNVLNPPTITGNLDLGSISRVIEAQDRGELSIDAVIAANISGTGGLVKASITTTAGNGTLLLTGDNTYTGDTFLVTGQLAVGSDTALGAASNRLYTAANLGLLAYGGKRTLANTVFVTTGTMPLGFWNDLTFTGPVNITGGVTFNVVNNVTVEFSGGLGETFLASNIAKSGAGFLVLSSFNSYSGSTSVTAGSLILRDQGTALNSTSFSVSAGASLILDNDFGANLGNRIGDAIGVSLTAGEFAFIGKAGEISTESLGVLTLNAGSSALTGTSTVLSQASASAGSAVTVTFVSQTRNTGAVVHYVGAGVALGTASTNQIRFLTTPAFVPAASNILAYATLINPDGSRDFVTHAANGSSINAAPFVTSLTAGANIKLTGPATFTLGSALNINALMLDGGVVIDLAGFILTVASGQLISSSGVNEILGAAASRLAFAGSEPLFFVEKDASLEVSSTITGTAALRKERDGTLILSGDNDQGAGNQFTGAITVNQGVLNVRHDRALGTTTAATTVTAFAALEIQGGVSALAENMTITGIGIGNTGALRSLSGTNTLSGILTLGSGGGFIGVENGSELNLGGNTAANGNALIKLGEGTLTLSGGSSNLHTGTTTIYQGTLLLSKAAGDALRGAVVIGDHVGGDNADQLVFGNSDQLLNPAITVNSTGLWNLNDFDEQTTGALTLFIGPSASADIATGAGILRTGNVVLGVLAGGQPAAATISGIYGLLPAGGAAATRTFTVNDSGSLEDLIITATIIDGGGAGNAGALTKAGNGRMVLAPTGPNTYTGLTTVSAGRLNIRHDEALGDAMAGTTVASAAQLQLQDGITVTSELLTLNGTGISTSGALRNFSDDNTWNGPVVLAAASTIGVETGSTLTILGAVSGSTLTKTLAGTLIFAGATTNTNSGVTVNEGTLILNKSGVNTAITAGTLIIGNDAGADNDDRVILANDDQIADAVAVTINSTGQLDLRQAAVVTTQPGGAGGDEVQAVTANPLTTSYTLRFNGVASGTINVTDNAVAVLAALEAIPALAGNISVVGTGAAFTVTFINTLAMTDVAQLASSGFDERLAAGTALTMTFAATNSANLNTGQGVLTLGGNVAVNQAGSTTLTADSTGAEIGGRLDFDGGTRTFTVASNALLPNEARITATFSNGNFTKAGAGSLALLADNSAIYAGTTTLSAGNLSIGHNDALGTGTLNVTNTAATSVIRTHRLVVGGVVLPNAVTLNANLAVGGNQDFTFGGLVTQVGAARVLTINAHPSATVDLAGGINLGGAFALNITTSTFNSTHRVSSAIVNGVGAGGLTKAGTGMLILETANTFTGVTTVSAGLLRLNDDGALGTGSNTTISAGAALLLAGGRDVAENLVLSTNARGFVTESGALRSVGGTNTWSGNISKGTANGNLDAIGVDAGSTLIITGQITQTVASVGLLKVGEGTLRLEGGATANTFGGTTTVRAGTLELNMNDNVNAFGGALTIGDEGGGANADRVVLLNHNQIPDVTVTVTRSGQLDLNDFSDTIGALTLNAGANNAGDVTTGSGTLTLGSNVVVALSGFSDGTSPAATIRGHLALGTATRTFTVSDSLIADAADDLVVSAVISGSQAIVLNGAGTIAFTAANTYTGSTTRNAAFNPPLNTNTGTLILRDGGSVANVVGNSFIVNAGAELVLDNTAMSADRIFDTAPVTLAGGTLRFIGNSGGTTEDVGTVTVNAGTSFGSTISSETTGDLALLRGINLARGAGGNVRFIAIGADLGSATNQILFNGTIAGVVNGILPYATLDNDPDNADLDFVRHTAGIGINAAPFVTSFAAAGATDNVKLTADDAPASPQTINALMLIGPNVDVTGGSTLSITSAHMTSVGSGTTIATPTLAFGGAETHFFVENGSTLAISSDITGSGTVRKERDGTLILSGDNGYTGAVSINSGQLVARSSAAFGTAAGGVTVNALASLVLDSTTTPLAIGNETLVLNGNVNVNNGRLGVVQVMGANGATWGAGTTTFTLNSNPIVIDVADGSSLTVNATVGTGGNGLTKIGLGTLILGGTANNAYTGTTTVNEGTLQLNKESTSIRAINGPLVIGDFAGPDRIEFGPAATGGDQILNTQTVTINRGAEFDLEDQNEQITNLTMTGGSVDTGAGTLTFTGALTYNIGDQATISGNLDLAGGTRTFLVNDGAPVNGLVIAAAISNGTVTKTGTGTLLLTGTTSSSDFTLAAGVLALASKDALGSGSLTVTGTSTLRPEGLDLTGADAIANAINLNLANNTILTLGGRSNFGGTHGIELSGIITFQAPGAVTNMNLSVEDPLVDAEISGSIGGGNGNLIFRKVGFGKLVLSGDNDFLVQPTVPGTAPSIGTQAGISIDAGILSVQHSNALGGGGFANVNVRGDTTAPGFFAALELEDPTGSDPVHITNRNLVLFFPDNSTASGYLNDFTGVLRNIAGDNSITGTIDLRNIANSSTNSGTVFLGVDAGTLDLIGPVIGSRNTTGALVTLNRNVVKVGDGTLRYSGAQVNSLTGTTFVLEGTLELNKSGFNAISGPVVIGDNVGAADSDVVRFQNSDQILDTATVTVHSTGWWDLNDNDGGVTSTTTLTIGQLASARISTGSGTLSIGSITANVLPGVPTAVSALLTGTLSMAATRIFTVNDGPATVELDVQADITETAAAGLTKAGVGRLVLAGDNSYSGTTTVNANGGVLNIQSSTALGTTAAGTVINVGGSLELEHATGITITDEDLSIATTNAFTLGAFNGTGIINGPITALVASPLGTGSLRNISGDNAWTNGTITLAGSGSTAGQVGVAVNGGSLVLKTVLNQGVTTTGLVKLGSGPLELAGDVSNSYVGQTTVNEGKLILNKSLMAIAVPGALVIGDNVGGADADVVEYALTAGDNQIGNGNLTVNSTGLLNLNGISDSTTGTLVLGVGPLAAARILIGMGTLTVANANHRLIVQAGTTAATPSALISGTYALQEAGGPAATRTFTINDSLGDAELTFDGSISNGSVNAQSLVKNSAGTLLFGGNANLYAYTGTTTVNHGTLAVDGTLVVSNTTINNSGTLGGTGNVQAITVNGGGSVSPTSPVSGPGVLTSQAGNVTFNAATGPLRSVFQVQLTGAPDVPPLAGSGNGQLAGNAAIALNGNVVLDVIVGLPTFLPVAGQIFTILNKISAGGPAGFFVDALGTLLTEGALVTFSGIDFIISYLGGTGNDVILTVQSPQVVYVDDDWAGTPSGTNPSPNPGAPLVFGYNAFADIQGAIDAVSIGGTVVLYGGSGGTYLNAVNIDKDITFETRLNTLTPAETVVDIGGAVTLTNDATFSMQTADLTFSAIVAAAAAGGAGITVNGDEILTFAAAVGMGFALSFVTTDATGTTRLNGPGVTTSGDQTYGDAIVVGANTVLTSAATISFASTVDSAAAQQNDLTVSAATATFSANVGAALDGELGSLSVTSDTAQTLNVDFRAQDAVSFTVNDAAGAGQDLTVSSTIQSIAGAVTLQAGDDVTVLAAASMLAGTTITINGDFGDQDGDTGTIITVDGTLTATSAAINGNGDDDIFHLHPYATTVLNVNGFAPVLPSLPGDTLNLDLTGVANPVVTPTGIGDGNVTSTGHAVVNYVSIETFNAIGNTFDLCLQGPLDANPDTFEVVRNAANLQAFINGSLAFNGTFSAIDEIIAKGNGDGTTLIVDNGGGIINRRIDFQANSAAPLNLLVIEGSAGGISLETYTTGTAQGDGSIVFDPDGIASNGDEERIDFTNVDRIDDTKEAVAVLNIQLTSGDDIVNIVNGNPVSGFSTTWVDSDNGLFTSIQLANKTTVNVNGLDGADTFNLNNTVPGTGLVNLNVFGNDSTGAESDDNAADVFNVMATAATVTTTLAGAGGNDVFSITNAGTVNGILGTVDVQGGSGANQLTVNDSASGIADTNVVVTSSQVTGIAPATINYSVSGGGTFSGVSILTGTAGDTVNVQSTLAAATLTTVHTGGGNDVINVSSNAPTNTGSLDGILGVLTVEGGSGTNQLNVSDAGDADADTNVVITNASITGLAPVTINYLATGGTFGNGVNILGGTNNDTFNVQSTLTGAPTLVHTGGGNDVINVSSNAPLNTGTLDNLLGTLTIEGGIGSNTLNISDAGDPDLDIVMVTNASITGMAPTVINYQATGGTFAGGINLFGSQAGNTYNVLSTLAGGTTTIVAQNGNDLMQVSNAGTLDGILGNLDLQAGGGAENVLNVSDLADPDADTNVVITSSAITGLAPATISYATTGGFSSVNISAGTNNDIINVQSTLAAAAFTQVNAGDGNDVINVSSDAPLNTGTLDNILGFLLVRGGGGTNQLNVSDAGDADADTNVVLETFGTVAQITGLAPATISYEDLAGTFGNGVFVTGGTGGDTFHVRSTLANAPLTVNGGGGNDTFNLGNLGNSLDDLVASSPITIQGGLGSNTLNVNDQGDPDPEVVIVTDASITGMAPAVINYAATGTFGGGITLNGSQGANSYNVQSTLANATTTIVAQGEDDIFNVTNAGTLDGIAGNLDLQAGGGANSLNVSDILDPDADTNVVITSSQITGLAPATISYATTGMFSSVQITAGTNDDTLNVRSTLADAVGTIVDGGSGNDTLNVSSDAPTNAGNLDGILGVLELRGGTGTNTAVISDAGGSTANGNVVVTSSLVTDFAGPTDDVAITFGATGGTLDLTLRGSDNVGDVFHVQQVAANVSLTVATGAGSDSVDVGNLGNSLDDLLGPVDVQMDDNAGDSLTINDTGDGDLNTYTIGASNIDRNGAQSIGYSGVATLVVNTGTAGNAINVTGTSAATMVTAQANVDTFTVGTGDVSTIANLLTLNGGGGLDTLTVDNSAGAQAAVHVTPTTIGASAGDTYFGAGGSVAFSGMDQVTLQMSNAGLGDIITVQPSATTRFEIFGNDPVPPTTTGDALLLDLVGVSNPIQTILPGQGNGIWSFGNRRQVEYHSIEEFSDVEIVVTAQDRGGTGLVKVFDAETGAQKFAFRPFGLFNLGVTAAAADVTGDGIPDIIVGQAGGGSRVRVYNGASGALLPGLFGNFRAFAAGYRGGVHVAGGDVNHDGVDDVIVSKAGGKSAVRIYDGLTSALLSTLLPFGRAIRGARVAVGDVNGDGREDLIVGAGPGHLPLVRVWDMATGRPMAGPLGQFLAYQASFRGGVFVAAGFLNGDGRADIVTGMGFGGGPKVKVFDGVNGSLMTSFLAFQPKAQGSVGLFGDDNLFRSGLRVGTTDLNGDGRDDILVSPGRGEKPLVKAFQSLSRAELDRFFAFQASYLGGVYVGGS